MINQQLKAKCKSQRASLAEHNETLISYSWKVDKAEGSGRQHNVAGLQKRLNPQWHVCYTKAQALAGKEWDTDKWDVDVWVDAMKILYLHIPQKPLGLQKGPTPPCQRTVLITHLRTVPRPLPCKTGATIGSATIISLLASRPIIIHCNQ